MAEENNNSDGSRNNDNARDNGDDPADGNGTDNGDDIRLQNYITMIAANILDRLKRLEQGQSRLQHRLEERLELIRTKNSQTDSGLSVPQPYSENNSTAAAAQGEKPRGSRSITKDSPQVSRERQPRGHEHAASQNDEDASTANRHDETAAERAQRTRRQNVDRNRASVEAQIRDVIALDPTRQDWFHDHLIQPDGTIFETFDWEFDGTYTVGLREPLRGWRGRWEFFSHGVGSSEDLAQVQTANQDHWRSNNAHPTADQIRELRDRHRLTGEQDLTEGIHLVWVPTGRIITQAPDGTGAEEAQAEPNRRPDRGRIDSIPDGGRKVDERTDNLVKEDTADSEGRRADPLSEQQGKNKSSTVQTKKSKQKTKPGFVMQTRNEKNERTLGLILRPEDNSDAMIPDSPGGTKQRRGSRVPSIILHPPAAKSTKNQKKGPKLSSKPNADSKSHNTQKLRNDPVGVSNRAGKSRINDTTGRSSLKQPQQSVAAKRSLSERASPKEAEEDRDEQPEERTEHLRRKRLGKKREAPHPEYIDDEDQADTAYDRTADEEEEEEDKDQPAKKKRKKGKNGKKQLIFVILRLAFCCLSLNVYAFVLMNEQARNEVKWSGIIAETSGAMLSQTDVNAL